ncbi:LamG domain-containing protein [Paenibacillus sp. GCM10023248]|uniref:LamG domain-containing protein n=1 Tax=unclassified Paenibacillus TaxID=185978 RepID=UPI002377DB1E|nr:LamG domain-containing protein [Paenibacillus sp. MAHUQ-63]MDD9266046.1 LamG domain-containing protein [Paenibacillus sp. MAHUQ-63]
MAWITPRLNWTENDYMNPDDWNRIENNIKEVADYLNSIQYNIVGLEENLYALSFDGVDDAVNCGNSSVFDLTQLTVECWIKPGTAQVDYANIIDKSHTSTTGWAFEYNSTTSQVYFFVGGAKAYTLTALKDNRWHHIAATYDGVTIRIYVDGVLEGSGACPGVVQNTGNLYIGSWQGGSRWFKGCVDDVRIWNYARSQAQIQDSMRRFLKGTEPGLIAYWRCDQGTGTSLVPTTGVAFGTLTGGTAWTSDTPKVGIVKNRTNYSIDFLSSINRIEQNIEYIKSNFMVPSGYGGVKSWAVGTTFDYNDAIRLEKNVLDLLNTGVLVYQSFVYCGTIRSGESGGLY